LLLYFLLFVQFVWPVHVRLCGVIKHVFCLQCGFANGLLVTAGYDQVSVYQGRAGSEQRSQYIKASVDTESGGDSEAASALQDEAPPTLSTAGKPRLSLVCRHAYPPGDIGQLDCTHACHSTHRLNDKQPPRFTPIQCFDCQHTQPSHELAAPSHRPCHPCRNLRHAVLSTFRCIPRLQHLQLVDIGLDNEDAAGVLRIALQSKAISTLDLRNNFIGPEAFTLANVSQKLVYIPWNVTTILLHNNPLKSAGTWQSPLQRAAFCVPAAPGHACNVTQPTPRALLLRITAVAAQTAAPCLR
jgi:hypothetical protein